VFFVPGPVLFAMARQNSSNGFSKLVGLATRTACGHKSSVTAVAWSCCGSQLLAGGDNTTVRVYETDKLAARDLLTERDSLCFTGHKAQIEHVVAAPNDLSLFATTGYDKVVNVYDIRKGRGPVCSLPLGSHEGVSMAWSDDGKWIVTGDAADAIYIVNAEKREVSRTFQRKVEVNQMRWAQQGDLMFLALGDGRVEIVSWPEMRHLRYLMGHRARCLCIAVDPTGRRLAVSSADTLVTCWNARTLNCEFTIDRASEVVACMDYSYDGNYLATACSSANGGIEISAADTGTRVLLLPTTGSVRDMKWHPNKLLLVYCVTGDRSSPRPAAPRSMYPHLPPPAQPQAKLYVYGFAHLTGSSRHRSAN
jgi:THO complex subunit 3